ncbi:transposase [Mycolicibacterium komossense]|uniref:Transposase n=1 Tax=Mycolicibacterium komossense TaxID=1779 RepID=A0ABT3C9X6_9MYCO|nr:transposase [Mycolicibacterium komossense]
MLIVSCHAWRFGENMRRWGLLGSFGTVGDCFDNSAMESFWARMQVELLNTRKWATTIELAAAMADYIDNFYNVERRHVNGQVEVSVGGRINVSTPCGDS